MSDEPKKRSRKWIGWTAFGLFVLYPLSIGPAARLCMKSDSEWLPEAYGDLYTPITFARMFIRPVDAAFTWYIVLWCPDLALPK